MLLGVRPTPAKDGYEVLLLQVASEMGLMTLAWPVGKIASWWTLLTNSIIKLIFLYSVLRGRDSRILPAHKDSRIGWPSRNVSRSGPGTGLLRNGPVSALAGRGICL